jgi:hypothetical protein
MVNGRERCLGALDDRALTRTINGINVICESHVFCDECFYPSGSGT